MLMCDAHWQVYPVSGGVASTQTELLMQGSLRQGSTSDQVIKTQMGMAQVHTDTSNIFFDWKPTIWSAHNGISAGFSIGIVRGQSVGETGAAGKVAHDTLNTLDRGTSEDKLQIIINKQENLEMSGGNIVSGRCDECDTRNQGEWHAPYCRTGVHHNHGAALVLFQNRNQS